MKPVSSSRLPHSADTVSIRVFKKDAARLRKMGPSIPQALHQLLTQRKNKPTAFHTPPSKLPRAPLQENAMDPGAAGRP